MSKNWTFTEVSELFNATVIPTFAGTDDGQAHLNRIAKAITNESLDKRLLKQQETHAKTAFDKQLAKVATKTPEKIAELVVRRDELLQCKTPTTSGELLSGLVADYVKVHESKWTYKTKLEVMGCLKLVVDVMEDLEVKKINRQTVLDFRAKLMKLPANMYKIYPDKTIQAILDMPDVEPMSVNSVNKYIMRLNALLVRIPDESSHHSGGKAATVPMGIRPAFRSDCGHHSGAIRPV